MIVGKEHERQEVHWTVQACRFFKSICRTEDARCNQDIKIYLTFLKCKGERWKEQSRNKEDDVSDTICLRTTTNSKKSHREWSVFQIHLRGSNCLFHIQDVALFDIDEVVHANQDPDSKRKSESKS